ncbi:HNH endonuclease signature motif containing protein [Nocardioides sp. Root140]|uniref:HNH endonuclease signature motif containing protein n=1 Tax=Nocardioides sp. Root140 TaxID=1736460 RepID=UPI0006F97886|nr:HNH endonuclease signature motif containing protein [Nocardioides sp. Root140]KQY62613.1 hypothetical protein ASD30_23110 [Nocardioides sp. Root140]
MIETDAGAQPFEVDDLEGAVLLDLITDAKDTAWRAERRKLRLAYQAVLLDLITDAKDTAWRAERRKLRLAYQLCVTNPAGPGVDAATWGDGIPGLADYDQALGGEGTPLVAAFVTESWATATAVSSWTAKRLLANTLDLHHRLPKTWAAVDALELEAWRGCKIAEDTHDLSAEAAEWIDTELARLGRYGIPTIEKTIRSAIAKFHPDKLDNNEPSPVPGKDQWDVTIEHGAGAGNGTSRLDAMGDSVDLAKFHDLISDEATTMGRLGDTDTLGQRRAKALGVIADRQASADLLGLIGDDNGTDDHANRNRDGDGNTTVQEPAKATAMGDSLDLAKFHDLISDEATTLGKLGDTDTLGQRRAKALGVIADRQASADLLGLIGDDNGTDDHANRNRDGDGNGNGAGAGEGDGNGDGASEGDDAGSHGAGKQVTPRKSYLKTRLYIHVNLADLATTGTHGASAGTGGHEPAPGMAETNLFGAVTVEKILDWIRDLGPDATMTPVIDLNHDWAVDQHDPPEAMREQVITRDRHCVFPHCSVDSRRCDLDHIESYDDTGPPGQTSPDRLAPLCRRHHLAKTHGRWSYVRNKDGTYTWTNQYRRTWLVTTHGTIELPTN